MKRSSQTVTKLVLGQAQIMLGCTIMVAALLGRLGLPTVELKPEVTWSDLSSIGLSMLMLGWIFVLSARVDNLQRKP